jgi:5-methylcytosine-specific restriction endonuclease McrA
MSKLLTIQEASQETGNSRGVIWRAVRDGKLKLSKTTRPLLVSSPDLQDWINSLLPPISRDDLERMYVFERKSITQISKDTGIDRMVIHRLMKLYGIPRRSHSESAKRIDSWLSDPTRIAERIKKTADANRGKKMNLSNQERTRRKNLLSNLNKLPRSVEWKFKQSFSHSGEKCCRWMGGSDHYRGKNWQRQRRKARQRDNFTCQRCGVTEVILGQELDVHHISKYREFEDYNSANRLSNLISYCKVCHATVERELENQSNIDK